MSSALLAHVWALRSCHDMAELLDAPSHKMTPREIYDWMKTYTRSLLASDKVSIFQFHARPPADKDIRYNELSVKLTRKVAKSTNNHIYIFSSARRRPRPRNHPGTPRRHSAGPTSRPQSAKTHHWRHPCAICARRKASSSKAE